MFSASALLRTQYQSTLGARAPAAPAGAEGPALCSAAAERIPRYSLSLSVNSIGAPIEHLQEPTAPLYALPRSVLHCEHAVEATPTTTRIRERRRAIHARMRRLEKPLSRAPQG
jgi:hypothetical protein